ncbi:MAG: aminotransferase class V-fold PLP-dependent enzyme [Akkermansiaceae bacterium]|nr:aminotransferase class V-fold PLP-dependent enzyme [Akkermansiaceae bacterium]
MKEYIYADNAATSKLNIEAFEAMKPFLMEQYANASQPYSFAHPAKIALKNARETVACSIGASPDEIFFTSGGTESDNWAIKGAAGLFPERTELITSEIEHHAVLHSVNAMTAFGLSIQYLPVDREGVVHPSALRNLITGKTKLVSVMLSNNEVGTIEPISELAEIAHAQGALFHSDAVQSVGHIPINVRELGVDMLSASAHKFNGPKGIGFLYVKSGLDIPPLNDGGAQEFRKRAGTENIASIVGMATALKCCCSHLKETGNYLLKLESILLSMLDDAKVDYLRNGAKTHTPGNISLSFKDAQGELLLHRLDLIGICVSTGSACDGQNTQISHVLKAMKIPEEYAFGTIRVSLSKDNTEEEVRKIGNALIKILKSS